MRSSCRALLVSLLPALALTACSSAVQTSDGDPSIASESSALVVGGAGLYATTDIHVCWVQKADDTGQAGHTDYLYYDDDTERTNMAYVQSHMTAFFAKRTRLNLTGWDACSAADASSPKPDELRLFRHQGYHGTKGLVEIDLAFNRTNAAQNLVTADTVDGDYRHEFSHALGFEHEQNRPDSICINGVSRDSTTKPFGPPDENSIMSYCGNPSLLDAFDIMDYRAAYGSPGHFVQRENGATYRVSSDGSVCAVTSSSMMWAFGATPAIQASSKLWGYNLVGARLPSDTFSLSQSPCMWPDGFASQNGNNYLLLSGDDAIDGATPTICQIAPAQMGVYNAPTVWTAPATANVFAGRLNTGACSWPHSYYTASDGIVWRWDGSNRCQIQDPLMNQVYVQPSATYVAASDPFWKSPSTGMCGWPEHMYQSTGSGPIGSSQSYGVALVRGNTFCWFADAGQQSAFLGSEWWFPSNVATAAEPFFLGTSPAPGTPLYGRFNLGNCMTPGARLPDFAFAPTGALQVAAGATTGIEVDVAGTWGVNVGLSVTGMPQGVSATFYKATITTGNGSVMPSGTTLTVSAASNAWPQAATLIVNGATSAYNHSILIPLQVTSCVRQTCAGASAMCGGVADGCGGVLSCGTCLSGDTCTANQCCPTGLVWDPNNQMCVQKIIKPPPPHCGGKGPACQ